MATRLLGPNNGQKATTSSQAMLSAGHLSFLSQFPGDCLCLCRTATDGDLSATFSKSYPDLCLATGHSCVCVCEIHAPNIGNERLTCEKGLHTMQA